MKALVKREAAEGLWLADVPVPEFEAMRSGRSGKVILEWSR